VGYLEGDRRDQRLRDAVVVREDHRAWQDPQGRAPGDRPGQEMPANVGVMRRQDLRPAGSARSRAAHAGC
jgi:hypothetical protein